MADLCDDCPGSCSDFWSWELVAVPKVFQEFLFCIESFLNINMQSWIGLQYRQVSKILQRVYLSFFSAEIVSLCIHTHKEHNVDSRKSESLTFFFVAFGSRTCHNSFTVAGEK